MRFGMMTAAAAALVCAGQADAARFYEFQLKGTAYFKPTPGVGDSIHSYFYDVDYRFVFDTLVPAFVYYATDAYDGVTLDFRDPARPEVVDLAVGQTGPVFGFSFNPADLATGNTLQPFTAYPSFSYVIRVDPRYSLTVTSNGGAVTSLTGRTSDIAPSFTGLIGTTTITAVPEPATWAMMIVGVAFAGGVMRRRKIVRPALAA